MVKFVRFFIVLSILFSSGLKAQDLLVSGGNTVSTIICSNGFVFTWGNNKAGPTGGEVTGILGGGTTNAIESSPVQVKFPTNDPYFNSISSGITVKAVDAGSGAHFIAVDCYGGAWSWGNNGGAMGITGTGSNVAATTAPGRVKRGEAPTSSNPLLAPYLVDVKYVSGGNDNSYVILNNGTALGWGRNDKGQLANGNFTNSSTPVYIRTPDGNPLTNVIQIEAGDETAYALVDPDGDGLGTVYSWGAGTGTYGGTGMLGRNAAGTANNGAEAGNDNYARPVLKKDGTPLDGVVSISAADVMCLAMDATGYVWAWGNDGWGSMTGQGATVGNFSDPRRVVAGEWGTTAGAGLGETFLKAKAISGGQGYGMAVTIDGKPVAWGNNGACGTSGSGGHLGNGTTAQSAFPVFIRRNATLVDNNVVSISDGDTWGFYTTSNNLIYTWGNNALGQLGIGSTTCASYATQFTLPPCAFPAPKPKATISPRDFSVCVSKWSGTTLNSGFVISASLASSYKITWYRNGVQVATGNGSAVTYNATSDGTYQVKVEYVGTDAPCTPYVPAIDEITISTYPQDFTVPNGLTFCGSTVYLKTATGNGLYDWYTAATGGTKLGTSYRQDSVGVAKTAITEKVGSDYFAYVEQKGYVSGNTGAISPTTCSKANQMSDLKKSHTMVRVLSEKVTIDTVSVYLKGEYAGTTKNYTWQVCAYGTKLVNGKPMADINNVIACGSSVSLPGVAENTTKQLKIPVGITLPGSATGTDYWLGFSATSNASTTVYFECDPNWPVLDDVPGGEYLNIISIDEYDNPANTPKWGLFANIKFHSEQRFCDRLKVKIEEKCECSQPKTVVVNKAFDNDTTMCAGSNLVITGEFTLDGTKPVQKGHKYSWYKKVGTLVTIITPPTPVTTSPITLSLTNLDSTSHSGTYFFKVEDGDGVITSQSCYLQDSIKLTVNNPNIAVTPTSDQVICSGTKPGSPFTAQIKGGVANASKFQWFVNGKKITGATGNKQNYTFATPADTVFNNTSTLDKVYTYLRRDSSGVCPAVNSNPVTITVMPVLKPGTISANQIICKGSAPAALTQTLPTGGSGTYTYQWLSSKIPAGPFVNVTGGTGATTNLYVPPVLTDSIYYTRRVTTTSGATTCAAVYSDTIKISMVSPVIAGTVSSTQTICYNTQPADLSNTAHKGGLKSGDNYTYQWQTLPDKANPVTGWVNSVTTPGYTFSADLTDTTKYRLIVKGSCSAEGDTSNEVTIIVRPDLLPGSIAGGATICSGANPADITNLKLPFGGDNTPADWSYRWFVSVNGDPYSVDAGSTNTSGFVINSLTNTTSSPITYEYKREVKSLECNTTKESNVVKYTVTPGIIPGTISSDQTICKGATPAAFTNTPATGGSGTYVYEWQESSNNIAFSPVSGGSGANTALYTPPTAVNAEVYYRRKVSSGACPDQYSDTIIISLVPDMTEVKIASGQTICYNTPAANITISTFPTGGLKSGDSYSYRWESLADASGSTWTGPIGTTAGYAPGTLTDTMQYRLVVTGSCGAASTTSNVVKVTVLPDLKGGTIVGGGTVCSGEDPADIINQILPFGANGLADYSYDWEVTPTIPGTLGYSVPAFPANNGPGAVTYSIKRIVKSNQCLKSAESNVVTYTVNPTVKPGTIGDDQTLCSGNTISELTQKTPPTGGDGNYTYQWQYSSTGTAGSFVNVSATATGSSFTPVPQASTIYFARLDNSPGCQAVLSNPVKITILPGILAGSIGSDQDICSGSTPAEISTPPDKLPTNVSAAAVATWESSTTGAIGSWGPAPAPLVPSQLTYQYPGTLTYGTIYIRKSVYDPNGPAQCNTAQTAPVKIVTRAPLTSGQIGNNQTICENGDPVAFAEIVAPTGGKDSDPYTYKWQYYNGTAWADASGVINGATYDPASLASTTRYRRVVNDVLGCGPVNSNEVIVTVNPNLTPKVEINDPGETCQNASMAFQVINSANLGNNPKYEWIVGGSVQGTNSPSFSTSALGNGTIVYLKVTSSENCTKPNSNPAISDPIVVKVVEDVIPKVTLPVQDKICVGTSLTIMPDTASGGGAVPVYQWFKNGQPVTTATNFSYSDVFNDGDQLSITMKSDLDCVVPGTETATSKTITINVLQIPQPDIVESDATFCSGDDTTYTAVIGTGTTFKWFKDGLPLSNTTLSLIVNQPGKYTLQEDNGVCPRFSDTVTVTVIPTPIANAGSDIYVLENTIVTLNGSGGDLYSWSPAAGLSFPDIQNPTLTATENTLYILTVADATNTCSSTDEVQVFVERPVKIPNAFTPNKDGNNDTWEIENINGFPNVTFEVYNRWGTLVWKWTGNLKEWDGTNYRNGEVLPDGTYFYVIDLHSVIFNEPYSGYVQILK